ncbi:cytochrome c [Flavobacteriaceae bacterium MAR_2010_72]|nr:cytochrome c [Flavobacteriaceae bacterium MAR_2010_72]
MKKLIPTLMLVGIVLLACNSKKEKTVASTSESIEVMNAEAMIKRGEYLVNSIGCADCHSPKIMGPNGPMDDPDRFLSGAPHDLKLPAYDPKIINDFVLFDYSLNAAVGPWGTSFSANLTPDDTGIGTWTEKQFITAIKKGKYKGLEGSRDLLPPMPWHYYSNLTGEDLKSIFAYLKTIRPIENIVPSPIPPAAP